jgi:hypothetical protein
MTCDAGRCDLTCAGADTCANGPVACDSVGCTVRCGVSPVDSTKCAGGVFCRATGSCAVTCAADNSCSDKGVEITSAGTAQLDCLGAGACRGKKAVNAGQAAFNCLGYQSCTNDTIRCDAGRCDLTCGGAAGSLYQLDYCCNTSGPCGLSESTPCTVVTTICR